MSTTFRKRIVKFSHNLIRIMATFRISLDIVSVSSKWHPSTSNQYENGLYTFQNIINIAYDALTDLLRTCKSIHDFISCFTE